ncbi:hypothetical protein E2C01_079703 [Portunus trituberculatus]|uniref:Uncharacterized protein n=1 Tax=Portunus trituberculatus TaxID=210409 RepID=A0A5B7IS18_PORTR|nr:hypothetical protein [Portunus trituberculatus]
MQTNTATSKSSTHATHTPTRLPCPPRLTERTKTRPESVSLPVRPSLIHPRLFICLSTHSATHPLNSSPL